MSGKKRQTFYSKDASGLPENLITASATKGPNMTTAVRRPEPLRAQTQNQKGYIKKLKQGHHDILLAIGPAGSGKTYAAMRTAIDQYVAGDFDKIIITRPTVSSGDEDYGYLPGSLIEKLSPWCIPLLDIAKEVWTAMEVERMLAHELIEIAPLGFMRGRTLKRAIVIVDEAQNCSLDQLKMIMTRLGEGSRMIITGDLGQVDLDGRVQSGLAEVCRRIERRPTSGNVRQQGAVDEDRRERIAVYRLGRGDVVRHPVIDDVLDIFEETGVGGFERDEDISSDLIDPSSVPAGFGRLPRPLICSAEGCE